MRQITLGLSVLMLLLGLGVPAWAGEDYLKLKQSDGTNTLLGGVGDSAKVTLSGLASGGGFGTATAAAPTLIEAAPASFSFDLSGNARFTMGTLLSCEDQTNNLCMVSGGAVRTTTFSSVTAAATNSTVTTVPVGSKTFVVQIINSTSETKAATVSIYGNVISSTTGGILLCTVTLPSTATTLQLQDACPPVTANFPYYFYATAAGGAGYTSASSAPVTVYAHY